LSYSFLSKKAFPLSCGTVVESEHAAAKWQATLLARNKDGIDRHALILLLAALPPLLSRLFRMRVLDKNASKLDRVIAFKRLNFSFRRTLRRLESPPPEKRSYHASKFIPCGNRRIDFNLFII
jgi:hypothetical protein